MSGVTYGIGSGRATFGFEKKRFARFLVDAIVLGVSFRIMIILVDLLCLRMSPMLVLLWFYCIGLFTQRILK